MTAAAESFAVRAGLDEAGYGPMLGPLTVGFSAFRAHPGTPIDWRTLRATVTDDPKRDAERVVVADSKRVFTRNPRGSARLEVTALSFLRASGSNGREFGDVLNSAPAPLRPSAATLEAHPWYAKVPRALPLHVDASDLDGRATKLTSGLAKKGVEVAAAGVAVVPAGALNASFRATGNKAATLWSIHSTVIADLFDRYGAEGLDLTVDRLGGRARHGRQLATLLPFSTVLVRSETNVASVYEVHAEGRRMRIRFIQKGDATSLPVALGSCFAKYARELVMDAFNRHFEAACPGVKPTAGYVTDARRWIADVERVAPEVISARDALVRTR